MSAQPAYSQGSSTLICQTGYADLEAAIRLTVLSNSVSSLAVPIILAAQEIDTASEEDIDVLYETVERHFTNMIDSFSKSLCQIPAGLNTANAYIRQQTCIFGACQISRQRDRYLSNRRRSGARSALRALYSEAYFTDSELKLRLTPSSPLRSQDVLPTLTQLATQTTMQSIHYLMAGEAALEIHQTLINRDKGAN